MSIRLLAAALGCVGLVFTTGAPAEEPILGTSDESRTLPLGLSDIPTPATTVGFAFDYNEGKFGADQKSKAASIMPFVRLEWDTVVVRSSLPFFRLEGPFNPLDADLTETDWGVGDLTSSVSYTFYPRRSGLPFVDLGTKIKFPTATNNFGSDEFDVTLFLDVVHSISDRFVVFADYGYRFRGGGIYHDTMLAAVGGGIRTPVGVGIWFSYDWRESPFSQRGDEHELTQFISIPIGEHLNLAPYAVAGLSKASPAWGVGSAISWTF